MKNDNTIVIKGADKGSEVVVWYREDYLKEAHKQLSDEEVHEEVTNDPSTLESTIFNAVNKIRARGDLSVDNLEYFFNKDPRFARFYLLPKIHKRLQNVPGRLVISNCGYYTENISSFLDYHLQPLAIKVESYIKDTNHFLKKLQELGSLPKNVILCTTDIARLYPNIRHAEGLASIRKNLNNRENKEVTTDTLVELAGIVLKNNYFQFLDKTFKQKQGTAIGTKFAPPYSILLMADLEKRLLSDIDLNPYIWWRYIDDIFLIWEHGEESLNLFLEKINKIHPTIKFTADWSCSSVNFVDVKVIMKDGKITTDLYVKPIDTHQYLNSSSSHPYHCEKSIPYSQALRLNRIGSNNAFFDQRCNELEHWLNERGYSERVVRQEILKARKIPRNEL